MGVIVHIEICNVFVATTKITERLCCDQMSNVTGSAEWPSKTEEVEIYIYNYM